MKTSIIIICNNRLSYMKKCIDCIKKYTSQYEYEIIVVCNNCNYETVEWLREKENIKTILNTQDVSLSKAYNKGIKVCCGDDIVLLKSNINVTPNWLYNLKKCLYSSKNIGIVSPVFNYCPHFQSIDVKCNNMNDIIDFAEEYNISCFHKWKERLRLTFYCVLIKRTSMNKIGLFDEIFNPHSYEDDDYSFRARRQGFRLFLCKDTFVYCNKEALLEVENEKFQKILSINKNKFIEKWKIHPNYFMIMRKKIVSIIEKSNKERMNILQIGCGAGGTLLDIKNTVSKCNLYGIEENSKIVLNTNHFADIKIGQLEQMKKFNKKFFDCIIITQYKTDLNYYIKVFISVKEYLKEESSIFVIMPKCFNLKLMFIKEEIKKIFNEFSYENYDENKDFFLVHLKLKNLC
ncbi:glycosyltransferase family 2 protein [Haloimpatiens sp. FM7330]|uniref:glycosyltransferase family 2 protein n=1 Tax=Haloimpatiens sp. FM7330 TaxID=3298610 RepID=UPI00362B8BB2